MWPTNENLVTAIWVTIAIFFPLIPAIVLFAALPKERQPQGEVEGPFHGLKIKFTGASAAYFALFAAIMFWPKPEGYEVWRVIGKIEDDQGGKLPTDALWITTKPFINYDPDGSFTLDIPVTRGQFGEQAFPKLLVDIKPESSYPSVYYLDPKHLKSPDTVDWKTRTINLNKPVIVRQRPAAPFKPNVTAQAISQ